MVGSVGNDVYANAVGASYALNGQFNVLQSVFDERGVTSPSPKSDRPGSQRPNTSFIFNGSYARFRDISLAYTFPSEAFKAADLRVFVSGQNLITFLDKDYPLYDPESSSTPQDSSDPAIRNSGQSAQFGIDRGGYPTFKSLTFGLNLTFK